MKKLFLTTLAFIIILGINAQDVKDKTNKNGKYSGLITKVEFKGKEFKDGRKKFKKKYDIGKHEAETIGGVEIPAGYWVYMKEGMPKVTSQEGNTTNVSVGVGDVVQMGKAMAVTPVMYVWKNESIPKPSNSGSSSGTTTNNSNNTNSLNGSYTDIRDGKTYNYVKIGNLYWMTENIAYETKNSKKHSNDKWGRSYSNIDEAKKAIPEGWRLPSKMDWDNLTLGLHNKGLNNNELFSKDSQDSGGRKLGTDKYGLNIYFKGNLGNKFFVDNPNNVIEIGFGAYSSMNKKVDYKKGVSHDDVVFIRCVAKTIPEVSANTNNNSNNTAKTKIEATETDEIKDSRDGEVYKTIKIGDQWWFAENLRYDAGDNSKHANDKAENDKVFGKLYSAKYVVTTKNVCPTGWHVPSDEDWAKFESYLGIPEKDLQKNGSAEARGRDQFAGAHLKDNKDLGFNVLPAGKHGGSYSNGFMDFGKYAYFWTTTKSLDQRELTARTIGFSEYTQGIGRKITPLSNNPSFSIRCVKDGSATYTKPVNNSAKLKVTVKAEGGNSPAKNVKTYLYKSKSDCENNRNHVAVKTTNANGEVIFENLTVGEFYYVKAEKEQYSVKKETTCTSTSRITDKYENRIKISFY